MNIIDKLKTKIEQIEKLLSQVKDGLEALTKESQTQPKKVRTKEPPPSEEQLHAEYERLYEDFVTTNSNQAVEEFVKGKKKAYLNAFCKANSLPISVTKTSKSEIINLIMQWMVQRKAITKKAT